jgi:adenosylmethionine-8-amino-7-oxononanoate aminotransferase
VPGTNGVLVPPDGYLQGIRELCDRHGILLICDEVMTGFGRTGKWFALEHWNVQPDIMSFAKGVSSGYLPLGGIMVSKAIKQAMDEVKLEDRWMHAYTYSGHPTCCAVALRNLDIMEKERLWENAAKMGDRLFAGLKSAFANHPNAGDIRGGKGLLAAVEFVEDGRRRTSAPQEDRQVMAEMAKRGDHARPPGALLRPAAGGQRSRDHLVSPPATRSRPSPARKSSPSPSPLR